ncbi:MAG: UDP-4-amino-4,6-dideoxy-N-acetyl-beta-L-altrosamine transaminase [Kofleriaceae bacterium]
MTARLAIDGGPPVRATPLPYGRQSIDDADVAAVAEALRSDWLTTGPRVAAFERAFAEVAGVAHAVAVSSGTAALHATMHALGLGPGDEVIVPAMTFAASANAALYVGASPVFADVDPGTLLLTVEAAEARRSPRTRAIVAVDYAGQPCDYDALTTWATTHGLPIVADACHALGGALGSRPVGALATATTFSLHPVKSVTTGEGGMITTADAELAAAARRFRNHGIDTDHRQREARGTWAYDMVELGFNYRLPDVACALGESQLAKLDGWVARRGAIAARYDAGLAELPWAAPLEVRVGLRHGRHLYPIRLRAEHLRVGQAEVFAALRAEGIGVNVHYRPVYLHPYYQRRFGHQAGLCPVAEQAYGELLSLPMFPAMSDADVDDVLAALAKVGRAYGA